MRIFSVFLVSYILGYPSFRLSPVFTVFCHCAIYAILYHVSIMKSKKQLSQIFYQNSYRNFLSKERSLFGKLWFSAFFLHNCICNPKLFRISRPEVLYKKGILEDFAKFTGKHLCQSLFFNKFASLRQFYQKRGSGTGVVL